MNTIINLLPVSVAFVAVLVIVWRWRPVRQVAAPGCIGSSPGPQQKAENDCFSCGFQTECAAMSDANRIVETYRKRFPLVAVPWEGVRIPMRNRFMAPEEERDLSAQIVDDQQALHLAPGEPAPDAPEADDAGYSIVVSEGPYTYWMTKGGGLAVQEFGKLDVPKYDVPAEWAEIMIPLIMRLALADAE